jgi:threonine aldolase
MPDVIDLRSDTVTRPSEKMRAAMAAAEVGDDVYGEDPTVNRLEERAAQISGKEAALFVPTGTMGNTIALKLHTSHGEEIICESRAHVLDWELSMMAWFAGCLARPVAGDGGRLDWSGIAPHIRNKGPHNAPTALITLENTHNMAGGTVYEQAAIDEICGHAHERGIRVHIDGARIFNAAVATSSTVARIARDADSVMFCLSKGLGAPVGSMLAGAREAIDRGRLFRKRLGGGMRQAGILAAAGLLALEENPARLQEDHANAALIAERLRGAEILTVSAVATNIVIFSVAQTGLTPKQFSDGLREQGVLANGINATEMRMVTHQNVTREECLRAAELVVTLASRSAAVASG